MAGRKLKAGWNLVKKAVFWAGLSVSVILNIVLLLRGSDGVRTEGVIDGDTLVLEGKGRIRLRYADAPELEYCGGRQAKEERLGI